MSPGISHYYTHDGTFLTGQGTCQEGMEAHHVRGRDRLVIGQLPSPHPPGPDMRLRIATLAWEPIPVAPLVAVQQARRAAYPDAGEQLDAIWKELAALAQLATPEAQAMLARIQAVKARHPKPE